jgi:hypothetical protein
MRDALKLDGALQNADWDLVGSELRRWSKPPRHKQAPKQSQDRDYLSHEALMCIYVGVLAEDLPQLEGAWNTKTLRPIVRFGYRNLRQFMLAQLAFSVIGGLRFQKCLGCGAWFRLAPHVNRADRATCSDYCRFKLYRLRRRHALELYRNGWKLKSIAKELGSDIAKVKKWVANELE